MTVADGEPAETGRAVKIWDIPTRIVHWALIPLIFVSWATAHWGRLDLHRYSGYAILGLVVFRVIWGFVGPTSARFASFLKGPRTTLAYLRRLPSRTNVVAPGHNPLGALSVVALLALLAAQVTLGLFSVDVDGLESGPLADRVSFEFGRACAHWHHLGFTALLWLIGLHVAAIAFYLIWKRENLIGAMIGGSKLFPPGQAPSGLRFAPVWRIAAGIAVAALAAIVIARGFKLR